MMARKQRQPATSQQRLRQLSTSTYRRTGNGLGVQDATVDEELDSVPL